MLSVVRVFDPPVASPNFDFVNALPRQQLKGESPRGAVSPMLYGYGGHDAAVSAFGTYLSVKGVSRCQGTRDRALVVATEGVCWR
jgi:hypothetical protein